jgi:hypothetical protein
MKYKDLTHQKFGLLTVLTRIKNDSKNRVQWKCICDCGGEKITNTYYLHHKQVSSCGCLRKLNSVKKYGTAAKNKCYSGYKNAAKKRKLLFTLTFEELIDICSKNCYYCNYPPKQTMNKNYAKVYGDFLHNGIDRKDNSIGYEISNCVPCCKVCNYAKGPYFNVEEFKLLINNRLLENPGQDPWVAIRGRYNQTK